MGLTFRESPSSEGRFAALLVESSGGDTLTRTVQFAFRLGATGLPRTASLGTAALPLWLRLERRGDLLEARIAPDGAAWSPARVEELKELASTLAGGVIAAGRDTAGDLSPFEPLHAVISGLEAAPPRRFLRGDSNGNRVVDIFDAVAILQWLFLGAGAPPCLAAANSNGDGAVDMSDAVYLVSFLFLGGPAPGEPFPACGRGQLESDEALGCEAPPVCAG